MPNFVLDHECPHLRLRVLDVGTSHLEQGRVRGSQTYPFAQDNSIDLAAGLMKRTKPTEIEEFVHHRNLVYFCSFRH
jgi:hypothetical protein